MKENLFAEKAMGSLITLDILINKNIKVLLLFVLLFFSASIMVSAQVLQPQSGSKIISISSFDNSASESEDYLDFLFEIENIGTSIDIFRLISENVTPEGNNPDGSPTDRNIKLSSVIMDANNNKLTTITLEPGKKAELILRVFIPEKVKTDVWNCIQIKSVSSNFGTESFIQYSTYIPVPGNGSVGYNPSEVTANQFDWFACLAK